MANTATMHQLVAARVPSLSCCCSCSGRSEPDLAPEWKEEAVSEVTWILIEICGFGNFFCLNVMMFVSLQAIGILSIV